MRHCKKAYWAILIITAATLGAVPAWDITVYPTSTVAYGHVTIEGEPADTGDIVYGFVRGECRGKQPVKVHEGKAYMTMNIQGLEDHEPVYFKLWDASDDIVYEVNFTTYTRPNKDIGYPPDVLPINAVKEAVTFFFPPESLEMHPFEVRDFNVGFYCNNISQIKEVKAWAEGNLEISVEGLVINVITSTQWTGEENLEIELYNSEGEVIEYATVAVKVTVP